MSLILVCGSRGWTDREAIRKVLCNLPKGTIVLHGAARGADMQADYIARELRLQVERMKPDWERYGRRAGFVRNLAMLDREPTHVYAFWDGTSRGTAHTIEEARRRSIPVTIVSAELSPQLAALSAPA